jgi:hypothetical protein
MTPRCEFKVTRRRTCGAELHGIYRYCPEHLAKPAELAEKQSEIAQEYVNHYAGDADELEGQ